jgi:hypothetical protein
MFPRTSSKQQMMPDEIKSKKVTFATSLPMGERGTFTHDGDLWIAYRAKKNQRIHALVDRLVGIHSRINKEMIRWINARPHDAELVVRVLDMTRRAHEIHDELITEKAEAFTQ